MSIRVTFTLLTSLLLLTACGASDRAIAIAALEGDATAGEPLYSNNCASCHGATAGGGSGPNLVKHLKDHDLEDMIDVVLDGDGSMPPFDSLEDQ